VETCDVLIVGGGPAGSSCAARLREAGVDVLVRDAAAFPRDKPCAGWITPRVLQTLRLSVDDYARDGRTLQAFTGFRTGRIGGPAIVTRFGAPVSYGIRRCELDQLLLERSGARFRGGRPVLRLERVNGTWLVDGEIRTPLIVGAGGHFCPVARRVNGPPSARGCVVTQELELAAPAGGRWAGSVRGEQPELYFCGDLRGYGWCLRKGDYLNLGIGRRDPRGLQAHVRGFVDFLTRSGRIASALPGRFKGHAYMLYERNGRRLVDDGVVLIGDAAGLARPESGEGIGPAAESGALAATAILAANGRRRREDLEPYREALGRRFGRRRRHHELPAWLARGLSRPLLGMAWFAREVVLQRWFLRQPLV
jgi:flavin-dependent dehydrogenase